MPSGETVLTAWWESSVPAFQQAEDALVELGEGLVEYDAGRLPRVEADDLWAMSEIALAGVSERMASKPEVLDPRSTLISSLFREYGQGIDYFAVAYEAWRAGDDTRMNSAYELAIESFDRATDHAGSLARAVGGASQSRTTSRALEPSGDGWWDARIAGPADRRCALEDDRGPDLRCVRVEGHRGQCLDARHAAEIADRKASIAARAAALDEEVRRARRNAAGGCLLPLGLVVIGALGILVH